MLFSLQKFVWYLAMPPACLILLMLAGLLLSRYRRKTGTALVILSMALLYILSLPAAADMLLRPLEAPYPPLRRVPAGVMAVVVPGGGSTDLSWMQAPPAPNAETLTRLVQGVELAKRLDVPLVLCGGNGEPFTTSVNDAEVMAATAAALGMPRQRLVVENRSRNTLENSHEVRRLLRGNRIVLATSAYYMRRAEAMFAMRGFDVIPAATYHQVQTRKPGPFALIPRAGALAGSSTALAELLSMAWWRLRGEI
ncbi:MAG TPA: YdcF family protein [Verrucomicrobiae bacterium]|nr:YdcF family protein [Verrucomicrobiae bacterium]